VSVGVKLDRGFESRPPRLKTHCEGVCLFY